MSETLGAPESQPAPPLLAVKDLRIIFKSGDDEFAVVDGVDFSLARGRTLAIVGESGCGKSVTTLAIMGLLSKPGRIAGGSIRFADEELLGAAESRWQALRGDRIAMIFQEPMTSLNPAFTIGDQIIEVLQLHRKMSRAAARARAIEVLQQVRMPAAAQRIDDYPHRLSGGQRQRAMIAMALACEPQLLIADEPTTALDVTIQAQILALIAELQRAMGTAIIFISHDLRVVAEVADDVVVMYAGRVVERAPAAMLFKRPQHPYTVGLLGSMPALTGGANRLAAIEGQVPGPGRVARGCRFAPRCPFVVQVCRDTDPALRAIPGSVGHASACLRAPLDPQQLAP